MGKLPCITIPIPLFVCSVVFVLPRDTKKLEKLWGNKMEHGARTRDFLKSNSQILITFNEYKPKYLIHELYHTVNFICEWADVKDEETPAYMIGYLYEEFMKKKRIITK